MKKQNQRTALTSRRENKGHIIRLRILKENHKKLFIYDELQEIPILLEFPV